MILTLMWIVILLSWLGYETNWMRIRLLVGKEASSPIISETIIENTTPENIPVEKPLTLVVDVSDLRSIIAELAQTELELVEATSG